MPNDIPFDTSGLTAAQLAELRAHLDQDIQARKQMELEQTLTQIKDLMGSTGITTDQLTQFMSPRQKSKGRSTTRGDTKNPPKYRHPDGMTWTGKGRRPEWIESASNIEDYLIQEDTQMSQAA